MQNSRGEVLKINLDKNPNIYMNLSSSTLFTLNKSDDASQSLRWERVKSRAHMGLEVVMIMIHM